MLSFLVLSMLCSALSLQYIGQQYRTSDWEAFQQCLLVFKERDKRGPTGRRTVLYQWRDPKWKKVEAVHSDLETVKMKIQKTMREAQELASGKRRTRHQKPEK